MTVGVLAVQGDFAEHINVLQKLSIEAMEVRTVDQLSACDKFILPGGESTVMQKLMSQYGISEALVSKVRDEQFPVFGTCAGVIILSSLGLLDVEVERNAYGSQMQSFEADLSVEGMGTPLHASFIRAPRITNVGKDVVVLSSQGEDPVLVQQGRILASTFHTETEEDTRLHELFVSL